MNPQTRSLTVYFDGGCPLCRREIGFYRRRPGAERIHWVNLVEASPADLGTDLDPGAAMARFHVRDANGRLASGARGFALLWQQFSGLRWLGRVAALPGIVHVLELGYRVVLRMRRLWRKPDSVCELPPR
jgi:predicted DCC family thiol-disulfide oxidoreductase YuxK